MRSTFGPWKAPSPRVKSFIAWRIDHGTVDYQSESSYEGGSTQIAEQIKGSYSATSRFSQGRFVEIFKEESVGF